MAQKTTQKPAQKTATKPAAKKAKPATKPASAAQVLDAIAAAGSILTADGETVPVSELSHLHPAIRQYAVRCDSLTRDPDNARLHTERNLQAVANSLRKYGQQPLLLSFDPKTRVIKVGNGRHEVATDKKWGLNWKWIAALPSNLSAPELKAFAIADNRTAELAEWDTEVVQRQLAELDDELADFDASELGFDDKELDALLKGDTERAHGFTPTKPQREKPEPVLVNQWKVIINCASEAEQALLIEEFDRRGIDCTAPSA